MERVMANLSGQPAAGCAKQQQQAVQCSHSKDTGISTGNVIFSKNLTQHTESRDKSRGRDLVGK